MPRGFCSAQVVNMEPVKVVPAQALGFVEMTAGGRGGNESEND